MSDQFQSPFTPAFATPDMAGQNIASSGGESLGDGTQYETANSLSGLPTQPTRMNPGGGSGSMQGEVIPPADLFQTAGSNIARG